MDVIERGGVTFSAITSRSRISPGGRGWIRNDRGSGSILAIGLITAILTAFTLVLPLTTALEVKRKLAGTADAAALAAADVTTGAASGFPCPVAAFVADANGAQLVRCDVDGTTVTVRVTASILGFSAYGAATAGQPAAGTAG